jgi:gliding-associated putative ABC transporter substrate-binding component GldG
MTTNMNKKSFITFSAIVIVSLIVLNLVARNWFFRWDLTENKMYSLSESSRSVVSKIDDIFTMKVYFSENLPAQYGNNERYLQDILEEYAAYSSGNIQFEFYRPKNDEDMIEEAQKYGIQPVQLQVIENDKVEIARVFMGMVFIYEDQREVIPVIQTTTGLEYDITSRIKKMVDDTKANIGIATRASQNIQNQNIADILRQQYTVQNVDLETEIPITISTLLMHGVSDSLTTDEMTNLSAYLERGGKLFLNQNRVSVDIATQEANAIASNIFDLLDNYGLHIEENLVVDKLCGQVNVQQNMGIFRMAVPMDYPFLPTIQNFNNDEVIVSGLEQLRMLFPSEIMLDSLGSASPLLFTSDQSSSVTQYYNLNPDPKQNPIFKQLKEPGKVVSARTETGMGGEIILTADSKFMADDGGGGSPENHIFIQNVVDYLMGDSELIALRSREITNRPLLTEAEGLDDDAKSRWKWINILLPSVLVMGFGFVRLRNEKKRTAFLEEIYD